MGTQSNKKQWVLLLLAVLAFFSPQIAGGSTAVYSAVVVISIFAVMSYGLDIVMSDLGEVSLAHPVFFATGSYTTALLATKLGVGAWTTLLGSLFVAMLIALFVGLVTLRLREFVFSLVTYALTVVAITLASNWEFLGGSDGIRGIPKLDMSFLGFNLIAGNDKELWPYAFVLLVVTIYIIDRFRKSHLGIAALMSHQNPRLAIMSGISHAKVRLQVFVLSACISAAAGWLYAYQRAYLSADVMDVYFLIFMLTAVVLFGRQQLLGPLAATILILAQEKFFSLGGYMDKIILGSVLVLTLAFFPNGLMGLFNAASRRFKKT